MDANPVARSSLRYWIYFLCAVWAAVPALGQDAGRISGVVVDAETGESLIGVNVVIDALATGAATGLDGDYRITGLPAGTYDIRFSYLGYSSQTVAGVAITAGQTTTLDVRLSPETQAVGGEVVVEASALLNNEAGLLRQRQRAAAVSDAISAEAISRSGSSSAADAMERVTGASVLGGKYVYVRGLGERYASTQLNGADVPTADPDRRAVQFDLFPGNLLENIVTLKTFTPDRPGNFSGGLVDITTKSFPSALNVQLSASSSVNTSTHFVDGFLAAEGGLREVPVLLADPNTLIPNEIIARRDEGAARQLDAIARSFATPMSVGPGQPSLNRSYALSLGDQAPIFGNPLGYVLSVTYDRGSTFYDSGFTGRYGFSQGAGADVILRPEVLFEDTRSVSETSLGGIANVSYRIGPRHEIGVNTLYSRSEESLARLQVGSFPRQFDETFTFINRTQLYVERELYSGQLRGKHQFPGALGTQVEWSGSLAQTRMDEPDLRYFPNSRRETPNGVVYGVLSTSFAGPSRYFRDTEEQLRNAQLDVTVPVRSLGRATQVKLGGRYQHTDREGRERQFRIARAPNSPISLDAGSDGLGDIDGYLAPGNLGIVEVTEEGRFVFGNYVTEDRGSIAKANNYDAYLSVPAAYVMLDAGLTGRLRAIGGVRYEGTRQAVTSQALDSDALARGDSLYRGGRIATDDLLPSLNLVYSLTDAMNLRAAATQTLARPTFQELSPASRFPFIGAGLTSGNPALSRSLITNLDLRWEWFTRPGEIVAVSGYYKRIDDPIELVIIDANGLQTYRNVADAHIYGLELEARKQLDDVWTPLSDFSTSVNLSVVHSSIAIDEDELAIRRAIDPEAGGRRALQGQSPFILNADLTYEREPSGTSVGLYFNVFGRRLSRVSFGSTPDVYEMPSPQLDFVASQRVFRDWSLKGSVKNLLDAPYREEYAGQFDGRPAVFQEYNRGISFSLGVSYSPRFGAPPPVAVPPTPEPDPDLSADASGA